MEERYYRDALGKFATGVTVITTKTGGDVHGMTANAFMSISLSPKLIAISVGNHTNMLKKIKASNRFAVSLLSDKQQDISMHFAGQTKEEREVDFDYLNGLPVIKDALASIICTVDQMHVIGDHTLFIGEVEEVEQRNGDALTFYGGKYGRNHPFQYAK